MGRKDRRTNNLFGGGEKADTLSTRIRGYLEGKGWRVERRRGHYCKANPQQHIWIGDRDALDWQASITLAEGVHLTFYYQAQLGEKQYDDSRRDWMRKRRAAGEICEWFTSEDQFYDWYFREWGWLTAPAAIQQLKARAKTLITFSKSKGLAPTA